MPDASLRGLHYGVLARNQNLLLVLSTVIKAHDHAVPASVFARARCLPVLIQNSRCVSGSAWHNHLVKNVDRAALWRGTAPWSASNDATGTHIAVMACTEVGALCGGGCGQ